ncbi:MAG: hypothetical protein JST86_17685 [Bacteroidetes bacterium]|nr:hypothetical protein [Bacteroidota bacterium]
MNRIAFILSVVLLYSCIEQNQTPEWVEPWHRHEKDFKTVVRLMKANQLQLNKSGVAYIIPDSIHLQDPCEQMVYKLEDYSRDTACSYLFYLSKESRINRRNPLLVYTENAARKSIYVQNQANVIQLEEGWYFLYN